MINIAIIGHGRTPERRAWGRKIDSCDVVIRMWDWHWQEPRDYGKKYDIGILEIAPTLIRTFQLHNKHTPTIGWVGSALHRADICPLPDKTEVIDQSRWTDLGKRMGGLGATGKLEFTRGTIAACWAIEYAVQGDKIILVGFDNVKAGLALPVEEGFSPTYRAQPSTLSFRGYKENAVKYGNHDFSIEKEVLTHLAMMRNVSIAYADDAWK